MERGSNKAELSCGKTDASSPSVFLFDVSPRASDFPNGRSRNVECILLTSKQKTANWWQFVDNRPCECLHSQLVADLPNPSSCCHSKLAKAAQNRKHWVLRRATSYHSRCFLICWLALVQQEQPDPELCIVSPTCRRHSRTLSQHRRRGLSSQNRSANALLDYITAACFHALQMYSFLPR